MRSSIQKIIPLLILTCFFLALTGCGLFPTEEETLAPPLLEPEEVTYRTTEATIGYIEDSIKKSAYFVPVVDKDHFFTTRAGRLKTIHVKVGDRVNEGDVIAEFLTDGIERELEYQKLTVDSQIKSLSYTEQKTEIEIRAFKANLANLEEKYSEMNLNASVYTAKDIDSVKKELENQQITLEKMLLDTSNSIEMKKNELILAEMKLAQLQEDLDECKLKAEVSGIVTYLLDVNEGDMVDMYKNIVTISDPHALHLEYKGSNASDFTLGQEVSVQVEEETYTGKVVLTPSSVPYKELERYRDTVQIKLDKLPKGVELGDRAEIKLVKDFAENAVIIPKRALKTFLGKDAVYVLDEGIRLERYVEKGVQTISEVEITQGLEAGEIIIIE
ncbi:MAG: efflux RND transporter periplasmic adaptor subunit [Ruminiclostridium sp.]|nr:efflux RND transporter periplasmic adaptor subunit [Ruminiclostridium sp.]